MRKLMYYLLFVAATCTIGCSEDLWEDDILRTKSSDNGEYLDLKNYDIKKMTNKDFETFCKAEIRMGVYREDGIYMFRQADESKINISKELYQFIKELYENTNQVKLKYKGFAFTKNRNCESFSGIYDCVPTAISNMGKGVTYDQACAECDVQDPGWRERGLVQSSKVGNIIRHFVSASTVLGMSYPQTTQLNSCVVLLDQGNMIDHAVNGVNYIVYPGNEPARVICSDRGIERASYADEVTSHYPFNE